MSYLDTWITVETITSRTILSLTPEQASQMCSFAWGELPYGELMLYVMRHVQEHAAQLHMFLGQHRGKSKI